MKRRAWLGAVVILALAAAGAALYFSPIGQNFDAAKIVAWSRQFSSRWWIVPLYFLVYAILDVLFIPTQFLSIAGVLMWGWPKAGVIELFAATTGAILPYLIARTTLRETIAARLRRHQRAAEVLEREGFTLLVFLRLVPIIPYTALNYLAGLSSINVGKYVVATLLGMIPSTFIFAYFVQAAMDGFIRPREVMLRVLLAGALLGALIIATRLAAPRLRRRVTPPARTAPPPAGDDRR